MGQYQKVQKPSIRGNHQISRHFANAKCHLYSDNQRIRIFLKFPTFSRTIRDIRNLFYHQSSLTHTVHSRLATYIE